ncbi:MAG: TonB-dependent receptor [Sphingomonadales bacterium]|nr:TonB-dependent receptor [Sphingomonadales bacterium]
MRIATLSRLTILACGVSALALPNLAFAQTVGEAADKDTIVVTATRDARSLKDVPMQVNVATGEQLEKLHIYDVKDIAQLAPGLDLNNNDPRKNTTTLRGISFDPDQGTSPAVQLYYNEVPADAQTVYGAIYDIGQIEVLRGPQGLLRGLSAPAGSITIATRRPGFDRTEGFMQAGVTDRAGYNVQGGVTLPFSDTFSIRVAGLADGNRGNQVRNITQGGKRGDVTTLSGRITLGWRPSPDFTAYLTYQYLHSDAKTFQQVVGAGNTPERTYTQTDLSGLYGLPAGSVVYPSIFVGGTFPTNTAVRSGPALTVDDYAAVTDGGYRIENNTNMVNLGFDYDLGPATLSFVGAHQYSVITTHRDQDLGNAIPGYIQASYVRVPRNDNSAELRLHSNAKDGLGWSVSAFYSKLTGNVINDVSNDLFVYNTDPNGFVKAPLGPGGSFITVPNKLPLFVHVTVPLDNDTLSFAGNVHYFSGPLKIEAGLRYSVIRKTQTTQVTTTGFINSGPNEVIPANLQRSVSKPLTGGANISYEVLPNVNVYAAYGHSFRAPTTGVSLPLGITADLVQTRSEKTDSYEIGLKGTAFDRRLNFSLAGFYQKFDGYIRRFEGIYWRSSADSQGQGFFGFNYNGNATIKGVEASIDGRISDNWDFGVSASYAKARYDHASLPCNDFNGDGIPDQIGTPKVTGYSAATNSPNVSYCVSSGRISDTPDFGLTANTELRFPMGNLTPYLGALLRYQPGFFSDTVQYQYKDRELVNLFVGLRGPERKWSLDFFVRNLLDQHRITNTSLGNGQINSILAGVGGGTYDSGYRAVNAMNPREFGLSASIRF